MCDTKIFEKAYIDYAMARSIINISRMDDDYVSISAYHLHQAVEKVLMTALKSKDAEVPDTHDIGVLIKAVRDSGSEVYISSWIEKYADTITKWRDHDSYSLCADYDIVCTGIKEVAELLEKNGVDMREDKWQL